jgi:hypothetical protein
MRDRHSHPSTRLPVPAHVADILLWRLAVDVAAAHQPGHDGRCSSMLCASQLAYPCAPVAAAQRAAHAALCPPLTVRGRATVVAPTVVGRAAAIGAAAVVGQPAGAAPYALEVWPPPLRRPTVRRAA